MNLIGKIIEGRYKMQRFIGEGGMSLVFQAHDLTVNRDVALKLLKKQVTSTSPEDIIRFKNEIFILSRFDHPNIIKVFGVGEFDTKPYIVMELLDGEDLKQRLRSGAGFPTRKVVAIVKQITEALIYVHNQGVIHADLKPSNIFLNRIKDKEVVKLLDFGVARVMELTKLKHQNEILGTFGYMSPEAVGILNRRVDERSDLYSLGTVFYQLLTGNQPFYGDNLNHLLHQQAAYLPPRPGKVCPNIPEVLDSIVMKMLAKDPDERYQCAQGLLFDLNEIERGRRSFTVGRRDLKTKPTFQIGLVGREAELKRLRRFAVEARRGRGGVYLIAGEPGIGKSRLAEELYNGIFQLDGLFIRGRCINHINKSPYQPFKDALDDYLNQIIQYDEAFKVGEAERIATALGDLTEVVIHFNPRMEKLFKTSAKLVPLEPERENQRFLMVMAKLFSVLVPVGRACILFLDDLQWADEGSFKLLREILAGIGSSNLMILGTYRDDEVGPSHSLKQLVRHAAEYNLKLEELLLDPLSLKESSDLISGILGAHSVAVPYIMEKTHGNPFLVINILRELVENKILNRNSSYWELDQEMIMSIPVSENMVEMILKRIQDLSNDQRQILCMAAVIGREFDLELLYKMTSSKKADVVQWIDQFITMQLLEKSYNRGRLLFAHDRIRDAFYQQLSVEERREIHRRIAEVIEAETLKEPKRAVYQLADHYLEAGVSAKALQYVIPAAEEAKSAYANEEAINYYLNGLKLLEIEGKKGGEEWQKAADGLLDVYNITAKTDEAIELLRELLPKVNLPFSRAKLYKKMGSVYFLKDNIKKCEYFLFNALELLGEKLPKTKFQWTAYLLREFIIHLILDSLPFLRWFSKKKIIKETDRERISALFILGWLYVMHDIKKLTYFAFRSLNLSQRRLPDTKEMATALSGYAMGCIVAAFPKRALRYHFKALKLRKKLKDEWGIAYSLEFLGIAYSWMGRYADSIRVLEESKKRFQKIGDIWELSAVLSGLGYVYLNCADYEKSIDCYHQFIDNNQKNNNLFGVSFGQAKIALIMLEKGEYDKADKILGETLAICKPKKILLPYFCTLIYHGLLDLERYRYDKAVYWFSEAEQLDKKHVFFRENRSFVYMYLAETLIKKILAQKSYLKNKKDEYGRILRIIRKGFNLAKPWPNQFGIALRVFADYYWMIQKPKKAAFYFLKSIKHNKQYNRTFELGKSLYEYGMFLNANQSPDKARVQWIKANQIFERIGASVYAKHCLDLLGNSQSKFEVDSEETARGRLKLKRRLNAVIKTNGYLNSILDLDQLLEKILDSAVELMGAERGVLFLYSENAHLDLEAKIIRNVSWDEINNNKFAASRTIVDKVAGERKSIIVADAIADDELKAQSSIAVREIRSVLAAPVNIKDELIGVIYLENSLLSGLFSNEDLEMLELMANQAGISIENARLYSELKKYAAEIAEWNQKLEKRVIERTEELNKKNEELEVLNRQLEAYAASVEELAVANERNRLAREVHDTIGHSLTVLIMLMKAAQIEARKNPRSVLEKLTEGIRIAQAEMSELRHSITGLMTKKISDLDVIKNIESLLRNAETWGVDIEFTVFGDEVYTKMQASLYKFKLSDCLYKICKEAITNSLRHGRAFRINIIIKFNQQKATLFIIDNGRGCKEIKKGFGLKGMTERVKELNGSIKFGSDGETGFNIHVELPMEGEVRADD